MVGGVGHRRGWIAMAQSPDLNDTFKDIYEHPNIQRMLDELDPYQFEDFIGYVFTRAGFIVEDTATRFGQGLDLKLYTMPTPVKRFHAGVSVKHYRPPARVVVGDVANLRGSLAPLGGVPG